MDSHNALYTLIELTACKAVVQINRDKACLPVVAVYHLGAEADNRKCREHSPVKIHELLDIPVMLSIGAITSEVILVIKEVELHAVILSFEHADILALACKIHIEMADVFESVLILLLHAGILRQEHPDIIFLFIKALRQRAYNVCKTSCLDKRDAFARHEKNVFHI